MVYKFFGIATFGNKSPIKTKLHKISNQLKNYTKQLLENL